MTGTAHLTRLKDKVVIVTGSASLRGIGFAAASRIASEGAKVVLADLDGAGAETRASELRALGCEAIGTAHDVASEAAWERLVALTVERFGRLDGLVNNAGIVILAPIEQATLADWDKQLAVNQTGVFLGCRAAIAQMRRQGNGSGIRGGSIVNTSSMAGIVGMLQTTAYSATKGAVRLMTKTLALECGKDGIRVNSVHPGVTNTAIPKQAGAQGVQSNTEKYAALIPLARMGEPEELGAAIAFLLSNDAAYVTGTELIVDGGLTAQ